MEKRYTFLLISVPLFLSTLHAQLPYIESFETGSGYTADVDVIDGLGDYFARMDTDCSGPPDPCAVNFTAGYTGFDGNFYWAGEDHDDAEVGGAGNGTLCITLDAIDISANTTGRLNIAIAAAANDVNNAYDDEDDGIFVTYSIDGSAFQAVHTWDYYNAGNDGMGNPMEFLAYDADNDGMIGGSETDILTGEFETKDRDIDAVGNSLVIQICAHSNSSSEEWAVDNIVVTTAAVVPVELTFFKAKMVDETAVLTWQTASEINNEGFEIQRSGDGKQWKVIDFVAGNGNALAVNNYQFRDVAPLQGNSYYRLKQLDFDGQYEFSDIVSVQSKGQKVKIYPNPATHSIRMLSEETIDQVHIFNQLGTLAKTIQVIDNELDISNLPQGIYFLQVGKDAKQNRYRIIKI